MTSDDDLEALKNEIVSSMAQIEDKHHRVVLSLMIRIMSTQERFSKEIYDRLDTIIHDEERIKLIALNGHTAQHAAHHDWIKDKIESEEASSKEFGDFFKGLLGKLITLAIVFILGFHAQKFLPNLFGVKHGAPAILSPLVDKGP
jgi:sulfatase maturation enzyme AslB (radical SAM superfamily)